MNAIRVNRRSLGVSFSARGEAEVLVWAPFATRLSLVLTESGEEISLEQESLGYWSCFITKLKPGDRYRYRLNERDEFPDPASLFQPLGVAGPSQVFNPHSFPWTDYTWNNIPLQEYVFYEIHTGTFTYQGTFSGIADKLDYVKDLGITTIELMPVAQFSGNRNWGYDGVFPFAVQNSYGGPESLQHLVNACHKKGIAVVLDIVYNHVGPEGNVLQKFGPYFTDKYHTPWGDAVNMDDAGCDAVRKYIIENALMWFRDFHIDALRLDAVHAIKDFSPTHILRELKEYTTELTQVTGRPYYLIVESDLNDVRFIDATERKGFAMDAQWADEFHHALRVVTGNERNGYYKDFNGLVHFAKSYRDAYVYDGIYSPHRQKTFGTKTTGFSNNKFVVFSQNHDHIGNRMLGERIGSLVSFEMQKVMAAAVIMSPFLPLLFMGEEYGETNPFQYFVDHSDEELIESVRKGRKKEFTAFHQEGDVPDPKSAVVFQKSALNWSLVETARHAAMLSYYKDILSLRKNLPAITRADREQMTMKVFEAEQLLIVKRDYNGDAVLCIFNFSGTEQEIINPFPNEPWIVRLYSSNAKYGTSSSESCPVDNHRLRLSKESFLLLTNDHV
jgi:maltooligosyltrehalose trehalohydrolase